MELVLIVILGIGLLLIHNYRKKLRRESGFPSKSEIKQYTKAHKQPTRAQKQMVDDMMTSPALRQLRNNPPRSRPVSGSSIPYMPPPLYLNRQYEFDNYKDYIYRLVNAGEVVRAVREMKEVNRIHELTVIPLEDIREIEKLII